MYAGPTDVAAPRPGTRILCYTAFVSTNVTLNVDEELLRSARKVALDRNSSVNQLVRDFLVRLVQEAGYRRAALANLEDIFANQQIEIGPRRWKREELHDRSR